MPAPQTALHQFQMIVLEDAGLQRELRRCPDRPGFVALLLERARERGFAVERAEVEAALDAAARARIMHWVQR